MSINPFISLTSRTIVLRQDNIDTDQIFPSRFLTTNSRDGLGRFLFYDWRFDEHGVKKAHNPFGGKDPAQHMILVVGRNFGCGSSREHALWALAEFGVRAVISSDIADIFKNNAPKNGLLPVEVEVKVHQRLLCAPGEALTIDLKALTIKSHQGWQAVFEVEPFARRCLLDGVDSLDYLLGQRRSIETYEKRRQ